MWYLYSIGRRFFGQSYMAITLYFVVAIIALQYSSGCPTTTLGHDSWAQPLIPVNSKKAGTLVSTCLKGISTFVVYVTT